MYQEPMVDNCHNINQLVIDIYQNVEDSQQYKVSKPMIKYCINKVLNTSRSKCLFCDDFSIINEGLCQMCKYYRYTQPRLNKK